MDQIQTFDEMRVASDVDSADVDSAPIGARRPDAVFLHAGWRSCGTWLWDVLRESPAVRAFYEPLHEGMADLDRAAIGQFRPDNWGSGHGGGAPYFTEFAALLNPSGRGVECYRQRFAFHDFFAEPDRDDPALSAYLARLIDAARLEGRLPVLKFCRSMGRVGWMERQFPNALHAVILRDPVAQWRSARLQMERDSNHYFVLAPFLILARNAAHPLLADALKRLDVCLPPHLSDDPGIIQTTCWRHVQRLSWADRYRGFLALWSATALTALSTGAMVIDSDLLQSDVAHRDEAGQALGAALGQGGGVRLDLSPEPAREQVWVGSKAEAEDAARAALAALGYMTAHQHLLAPDRARLVTRKLTPSFEPPVGAAIPALTGAALPPVRPIRHAPMLLRYVDAVVYLALSRASYPLRRGHYYVRRWIGR